jgi:hypothetical protein
VDGRRERSTFTVQDQSRSLGKLHIGSRRPRYARLPRELGGESRGHSTIGVSEGIGAKAR